MSRQEVGRHRAVRGGAARERAARAQAVRRRQAVLVGVSVLVTATIVVLAAVRPSSTASAPREEAAAEWGEQAVLETVTPAAKASATPTPSPTPSDPKDFPQRGEGTFTLADVVDVTGSGGGRERRYTLEVEDGLPQDPDTVAAQVASVLGDERGWRGDGWSFTQVESGADFRILLSSPDTVDALCAPLLTRGEVSCRNGDRVVLNVKRWATGVEFYGGDLTGYRTYLVNHEVGHALGKFHVGCPSPGAEAPVMMQQTKGLQGCVKNPWP